MKKTKQQKGITLIALIITIVVLLILAVVAIRAVQGDGIIEYAKNARDQYEQAQANEQALLDSYLSKLEEENGSGGGTGSADTTPAATIAEAMEDNMFTKTVNSDITDAYGNKITVPAGFKILVDSTTVYTANDINATKGIVITDGTNEFVWVPVGTIYTNTDKTESKTITLGRYTSFIKNEYGEYVPTTTDPSTQISSGSYNYTEGLKDEETDNVHAKDIVVFKTSAETKGGYYIGRYESGDLESTESNTARTSSTSDENTLVCKANQRVYNYVTQSQASSLSQNMYKDATTFTSDLINSYAWDTAIIFIQTFGGSEDYYNKNFSTSFANTGVNADKYCNIYDMSGNAYEWSTETSTDANYPCVSRGGIFRTDEDETTHKTSTRYDYDTTYGYDYHSFRPLLYL